MVPLRRMVGQLSWRRYRFPGRLLRPGLFVRCIDCWWKLRNGGIGRHIKEVDIDQSLASDNKPLTGKQSVGFVDDLLPLKIRVKGMVYAFIHIVPSKREKR